MSTRSHFFTVVVIVLHIICAARGANISDVIALACRRNPKLKLCGEEPVNNSTAYVPEQQTLRKPTYRSHNITWIQEHQLRTLAAQTLKYKNPFDEDDNIALEDDLVDFSSAEEAELGKGKSKSHHSESETKKSAKEDDEDVLIDRSTTDNDRSSSLVRALKENEKSRVEEYCSKYQENYAYYCQGNSERSPKLHQQLYKFCPSYELNCPKETSEVTKGSENRETTQKPKPPAGSGTDFSSLTALSGTTATPSFPDLAAVSAVEDTKLKALKKRRPCTPDCDPRIWKHCTAECKCDYIYPVVQRFCNPPPLPFFLNTCRLWYYGCPKYERYHYSSQFVYSKAEKGKVLPGGVVPVSAVGAGGLAHAARSYPPAASVGGYAPVAAGNRNVDVEQSRLPPKSEALTSDGSFARDDPSQFFTNNTRAKPKSENSYAEPDKKSAEAFASEILKLPEGRAKASQVPIVPSDSAFASGSIHDFDGYTDTRGVLHRPRSRSPFSKPGLWEPNPDNPHNRDHANKWWYMPESVTADWLSGQINWGGHWAVPAVGVGGTAGFSAVHFPTIGNFLNIADDYD